MNSLVVDPQAELQAQGGARESKAARKIAAIINCGAGSVEGPHLRSRVAKLFEHYGAQAQVFEARGKDLRALALSLRDAGYDCIAAGGGDGTVSAVASALINHTAALGVLPLGTLNHFARDLGIPLELDKAVELLCSAQARGIDVGAVNNHTFINNSSLGLYPDQVRVRQGWQSKIGKYPAMILASLVVLSRFRNLRVTAEFNGERIIRRCPLLMISNNHYSLEPGRLTERDRLDRGELGLYLLREEGRMGLLKMALHALVFKLEEASSFEIHSASQVTVTMRRRRVRVALDGEVHRLYSPLHYRILPGSLRVIAPPAEAITTG